MFGMNGSVKFRIRMFVIMVLTMITFCYAISLGNAASVMISPISLNIGSEKPATLLTLNNLGDSDIAIQVRIKRWVSGGFQDTLVDQSEIIASPPYVVIPAGGRQIVRLVDTNRGQSSDGEMPYRVLVDEIPRSGVGEGSAGNVSFQMRYSVPLFVGGPELNAADPEQRQVLANDLSRNLKTTVVTSSDGQPALKVFNGGSYHARITKLRVRGVDGRAVPVAEGLLGYVLAGEEVQFPMPSAISALRPGASLVAEVNSVELLLIN
ncbi:fimbrial biogenesis chaperone [Limibacillus halophilus]|uniref:Fimbrial chaperone protein n=1 Tax=Limibacillus halophilus TaxID=1579333 RepID=A0A839SUL5_9PROT|nr:fimbria/pilus periplasmic chaperone [Limibacillus halophilus]MBB3066507.1 fimbrial chaperone protein [Limibacillus halophilus]